MRSKRKRNSLPMALLVGLGVPVLALFGLFSLIPYEHMTAKWPLGITAEEVHAYQHWFDQRPDTMATVEVQRWDLDSAGACAEGEGPAVKRKFNAAGFAADVLVGRNGDDRTITFPSGALFREQQAVRMVPATMGAIRALYAREVAHVYGLVYGKAELVRLWSCGDDLGLFVAEELIDQGFVDREGGAGAMLVDGTNSPLADPMVAEEARRAGRDLEERREFSRINENAAALWGIVTAAVKDRSKERATAWFEPSDRSFQPALGAAGHQAMDTTDVGAEALAHYMRTVQAHGRMKALAATMRQDSAELEHRLAEVDARNAAAFVGDTRIGYVRAQLAQERKEFLHGLFHPEPQMTFGPVLADETKKTAEATGLDPFLRKYLVGDTVRIPRAKHVIDHVITVPAGIGVVLEKGARLSMAPGGGLVVNGSLHMRGTGLNPVFIRPAHTGAPWAAISVNGDGGTRCVINGLKMSGGSMLKDPSGDHQAMLSFHGCDVSIANSTITGAQGPSAIAIERGALRMRDCFIGSGKDALLDVSFAKGWIDKCSFVSEGGAFGVRGKGATLRFNDCGFIGFRQEGLALGTKSSVMLRSTTFSGNSTAVAAMDGSEVLIDGCTFKENTTAIELHRTREGRAGGKAVIYQNTFTANGSDKRLDEWSTCTDGTGPMPEQVSTAAGKD